MHSDHHQDVTGTAVATLAGVAGMVFKQNDRYYLRGVPLGQDGATIKLGVAPYHGSRGYVRRPFLLLDPFVDKADQGNHVLLEPDDTSDAYHVRRLTVDPATGDLSWDPQQSQGTFLVPVSAAALHSSGRVVAVNTNSGRLGWLSPVSTSRPVLAAYSAGPGTRVGLLSSPIAIAVTNPGTVLVLEAGTTQISAFDLNGNPVRYFGTGPDADRKFTRDLVSKGTPLDLAVDGADQIYVLYFTGTGSAPVDYHVDVYTKSGDVLDTHSPGVNVGRFAVDYWRSIYGANYDALTDLGTNNPRIDLRLLVAEPSLSRFDPTEPTLSAPPAGHRRRHRHRHRPPPGHRMTIDGRLIRLALVLALAVGVGWGSVDGAHGHGKCRRYRGPVSAVQDTTHPAGGRRGVRANAEGRRCGPQRRGGSVWGTVDGDRLV